MEGATIVYYTELIEISQVVIYRGDRHVPMEVSCNDDWYTEEKTSDEAED